MQKATLVLILLFGTLTLVLHDDRFIKWKPTVLYGAMAIALAVALLGLPARTSSRCCWARSCELPAPHLGAPERRVDRLLPLHGGASTATWRPTSRTEAWVNFKLWGYVFPIVFLIAQGLYISPHLKSDDEPAA